MSSFRDLGFFVHNNPEAEAQRSSVQVAHALSLSCSSVRYLRGTSLGFCLRVTVNQKTLNLDKTTFSVLSVLLLIYEGEEQNLIV